ncbi:MAG: hypothetical protein ABFD89_14125 [Bryobacteraceae bacterium]
MEKIIGQLLFLVVPISVLGALRIVPYWKIFKKAGFRPQWALLTIIPVVGLLVLYVVAFSNWRARPNSA